MNEEIDKLIRCGAIVECEPCEGQFLSSIFLIKKSNGKNRFILNLKSLNKFIYTPHFKLEDYRTAMRLLSKDAFMCSLDLKDAYFSISIDTEYRKYLRFLWLGKLYEFQVLLFGLNIAPYIFTKLMRPVVQYLRNQGLMSVIYLDDMLLFGDSYSACSRNYNLTKELLESLGFTINHDKSVDTPSQTANFLGFSLNSVEYTIGIPDDKRQKIKNELLHFSSIKRCRLRNFAHLIGLLVSICPAVPYGWMYTKRLERTKFLYLKDNDNYDQFINVPDSLHEDFNWWLRNIDVCNNPIRTGNYQLEIFSDASLTGWGVYCSDMRASGQWSKLELTQHTISWSPYYFYAFPPFCLILRVLQKIISDKAEGVVVVPLWPTQPWFPLYEKLTISERIEFPPKPDLLFSPYSAEHKMHQSLTLVAAVLSGRRS